MGLQRRNYRYLLVTMLTKLICLRPTLPTCCGTTNPPGFITTPLWAPTQRATRRRSTSVHNTTTEDDSTFKSSDNQPQQHLATGLANYRLLKSVGRDERISILETRMTTTTQGLSSAEQKEYDGLMAAGLLYEEQYLPDCFTPEHLAFKRMHNTVFVNLIRYCQQQSSSSSREEGGGGGGDVHAKNNVFYLDGPDAATSLALLETVDLITEKHCFIANRHESTCDALWALLSPHGHVAHATASQALRGVFGPAVPFQAYYLDGCGGFTPLIVNMLEAAFAVGRKHTPPIAVGFSIVGGNRNVVDKELYVIQQLVQLAKQEGMRVDHVLDDPERYGVSRDTCKVEGGTLTSWYMLEANDR